MTLCNSFCTCVRRNPKLADENVLHQYIEVADILEWLFCAGFPQYVQYYQKGLIRNVDLKLVQEHHRHLLPCEQRLLLEKLESLNRLPSLHVDFDIYEQLTEDSGRHSHLPMSAHWKAKDITVSSETWTAEPLVDRMRTSKSTGDILSHSRCFESPAQTPSVRFSPSLDDGIFENEAESGAHLRASRQSSYKMTAAGLRVHRSDSARDLLCRKRSSVLPSFNRTAGVSDSNSGGQTPPCNAPIVSMTDIWDNGSNFSLAESSDKRALLGNCDGGGGSASPLHLSTSANITRRSSSLNEDIVPVTVTAGLWEHSAMATEEACSGGRQPPPAAAADWKRAAGTSQSDSPASSDLTIASFHHNYCNSHNPDQLSKIGGEVSSAEEQFIAKLTELFSCMTRNCSIQRKRSWRATSTKRSESLKRNRPSRSAAAARSSRADAGQPSLGGECNQDESDVENGGGGDVQCCPEPAAVPGKIALNNSGRLVRNRWESFSKHCLPHFLARDSRYPYCRLTVLEMLLARQLAHVNLTSLLDQYSIGFPAQPPNSSKSLTRSVYSSVLRHIPSLFSRGGKSKQGQYQVSTSNSSAQHSRCELVGGGGSSINDLPSSTHDYSSSSPVNGGGPAPVFGTPLGQVMRDSGDAIPPLIRDSLIFLHRNGLSSHGLFRKSGQKSRIRELQEKIDTGAAIDFAACTPYDVADLLKVYLREIPGGGIFTSRVSRIFLCIFRDIPANEVLQSVSLALLLLPDENREVLQSLLFFLIEVTQHHKDNAMDSFNLGICLSQCMFPEMSSVPLPRKAFPGAGAVNGRSKTPEMLPNTTPSPPSNFTRRLRPLALSPLSHNSPQQQTAIAVDQIRINNEAARDCIKFLIDNMEQIFQVSQDLLERCRESRPEWEEALMERDLRILPFLKTNFRAFFESLFSYAVECANGGLSEWRHSEVLNGVHISYQPSKQPERNPLRMWRGVTTIDANLERLVDTILHKRLHWDVSLAMVHSPYKDANMNIDLLHKVHISTPPHPYRDFSTMRSWKVDGVEKVAVVVEQSVNFREPVREDGVRAHLYAAHFVVQPTNLPNKYTVTHLLQEDLLGRLPDYYHLYYGTKVAGLLSNLRDFLSGNDNLSCSNIMDSTRPQISDNSPASSAASPPATCL